MVWYCRTTRNPHAPDRYTGGSSSGPAAIVASGICSAALGTDGGGKEHTFLRLFLIFCILLCYVARMFHSNEKVYFLPASQTESHSILVHSSL